MALPRFSKFLCIPALLALTTSLSADPGSRASFVYVANGDDDSISIYSVDPATGRLAHEGYHAAAAGEEHPTACAVHPAGDYLYVTNADTANVSAYSIDGTNGRLTALTPAAVGNGPHDLAFDAAGDTLYVTSSGSDTVTAFSVDIGTGALTQIGAPVATGGAPGSVGVDPLGRFAWVANTGSLDISIYDIDGVTGALSASIPAEAIGGVPSDLVVDEDGSHVYVSIGPFDLLLTYTVDGITGDLDVLNTRPTGDGPGSLALQPGGEALYLVNENDGDLIGYTVDTGTGVATRIPGSFATGTGPDEVVFDPSGLGAYVTNSGSRDVSSYVVNGITKAPVAQRTMRGRNAPGGIALRAGARTKQGRFLYALNAGADTISGYTIDPTDGSLTSVGAATATGAGAVSLVADPLGRFLFTVEATADQITTYTVDGGTGVLTASPMTLALAGVPQDAAVEPSGRFIFVALDGLDLVVRYTIDPVTGVLSSPITRPIGADVRTISVDPTGQFVYVTRQTGTVEGFALANGAPVGVNFEEPAPGNPQELRFSPTGERAYGTLKGNNLVIPFDIDATTGVADLKPPGNPSPSGPNRVVVHPSGAYAYAAIEAPAGTGRVDAFTINDVNGNLADLTTATAGTNPVDLSLDPSGRYLYVSNAGSDDVSLLTIDPATGTPTSAGTTAAGTAPSDLALTTSFLVPTPPDCNTNATPDDIDISMGTSLDCNDNCVPDECETPDCNANGVPDECDLAFGPSDDCNTNGIPDDCDIAGGASLDCNTNGVPDDCDISSGTSTDCNTNGIPDDCDPDCNFDGTPDDCEVFVDCNSNGILDECDIFVGSSTDGDMNGIPDECECGAAANYCVTSPHTAGPGGVMAYSGSLDIPTNNLSLVANACPPQKFGIFFYGPGQVQVAFGEGFRCVGGMTQRINPAVMTNMAGTATRAIDLNAFPFNGSANTITPGSTWNFQFWFRDPNGGPPDAGFNLTDGISLTFCP